MAKGLEINFKGLVVSFVCIFTFIVFYTKLTTVTLRPSTDYNVLHSKI